MGNPYTRLGLTHKLYKNKDIADERARKACARLYRRYGIKIRL